MLTFPWPRTLLVAVGSTNTGPAPQINLCGFAGEKKNVGIVSPNPNTPALCSTACAARYAGVFCSMPNASLFAVPGAGCQITGVIQRMIMFQLSLIRMGMTGWIFRTF
jgi:hypothetical protein